MSIWFKKLIEKYTGKKEEVKVETPSTPQPQSFHIEKHKPQPQKAKKTKKKKVSHPELLDMGKMELDIWARQRGIWVDKAMSKEDIIQIILSNLEKKEN